MSSEKEILNKSVIIFSIGSIIGTYYEQILCLVKSLISTGNPIWVSRRALIYGPFSPVYGIGALIIYYLFCNKKRKWYINFIYGSLMGGIYEFAMSLLQEKIFGTISWDYSEKFLNIGGRTTVPFMIFWGMLVLAFIYILYPMIDRIYQKCKGHDLDIVCGVLLCFLIFDASISITATMRQTLRKDGIPPLTPFGEFCDDFYNDEYLKKIYDNAVRVEKK